MRHNKFCLIPMLFLLVAGLAFCQKQGTNWVFSEKDLKEVRLSSLWISKNLNIILYEKIQKPKNYRFVALLYRATYSKENRKLYISFHPIWARMNQRQFLEGVSLFKLRDKVDTFLISIFISEKMEAELDFILLKTKPGKQFSSYSASKFPLFSRDKFLGNSKPINIHITLDTEKEVQYPGIRDEKFSGEPIKIITNPVGDGKIVKGLSGFISENSDKSYYLGYFSHEVWEEYFMDSFFNNAEIFAFEKSVHVPLLWP